MAVQHAVWRRRRSLCWTACSPPQRPRRPTAAKRRTPMSQRTTASLQATWQLRLPGHTATQQMGSPAEAMADQAVSLTLLRTAASAPDCPRSRPDGLLPQQQQQRARLMLSARLNILSLKAARSKCACWSRTSLPGCSSGLLLDLARPRTSGSSPSPDGATTLRSSSVAACWRSSRRSAG